MTTGDSFEIDYEGRARQLINPVARVQSATKRILETGARCNQIGFNPPAIIFFALLDFPNFETSFEHTNPRYFRQGHLNLASLYSTIQSAEELFSSEPQDMKDDLLRWSKGLRQALYQSTLQSIVKFAGQEEERIRVCRHFADRMYPKDSLDTVADLLKDVDKGLEDLDVSVRQSDVSGSVKRQILESIARLRASCLDGWLVDREQVLIVSRQEIGAAVESALEYRKDLTKPEESLYRALLARCSEINMISKAVGNISKGIDNALGTFGNYVQAIGKLLE